MNNDRQTSTAAPPPTGRDFPVCNSMGPEAPHAATNKGSYPVHFYRIEFKRIDGDDIKNQWRERYPWLTGRTK